MHETLGVSRRPTVAPMRKIQVGHKVASRSWPDLPPGEDPFRQLVESVREYAIYLLDRDGHIRSWNAGAEAMQGYRAAEITGQPFTVLHTTGDVERGGPQALLETAAEHGRSETEGWRVRRDGSRFWAHTLVTALLDHDGEIYAFAVITRDLTDTKRQEDELRRSQDRSRRYWTAAISDALTGAFNRRYLLNHLRGAIERGDAPRASLLLFDVDHFKAINDSHGHDAGDVALKHVAEVARQISRESDMLVRLGGDEFVLYLPGVSGAGAHVIAQRLRETVAHSTPPGVRGVTISIGVAERRKDDTVESWLRAADTALYAAKQGGRNRVA
jgi:diguanylate cyclase (GGDEF)-like protein/PAS domain S-box-containing protein